MATTSGVTNIYNSWKETMVEAANLGSDTFKMLLTTSSYTPLATHTVVSSVTNELTTGSGYTRFTHTLSGSSQTSGVYKFDLSNASFKASGGSLVAKYWVIYDDTIAGDPLVAWGLLNSAGASVTTTSGNTLTVTVNSAGLFTIT